MDDYDDREAAEAFDWAMQCKEDETEKMKARIEQLEAALRFYAENCSGDMKVYKTIIGPSGDYGDVAKAALGEKKDD
jgi:hypothetical protein